MRRLAIICHCLFSYGFKCPDAIRVLLKMTYVMVTSEQTIWAKFVLRLIIASRAQYKILHKKQHQVNPVKDAVDVKCCVFKVSKYINNVWKGARFFWTPCTLEYVIYIYSRLRTLNANKIHVSSIIPRKTEWNWCHQMSRWRWNEPHRDKTNKMGCAPSEDSDQPGHPPSLIRVFAVRLMGS